VWKCVHGVALHLSECRLMSEVALGYTLHQLDVSAYHKYRHQSDSEVLHSTSPQCGTVYHLMCAAESFVISVSDKHHSLWRLWRRLQISRLTYLREGISVTDACVCEMCGVCTAERLSCIRTPYTLSLSSATVRTASLVREVVCRRCDAHRA